MRDHWCVVELVSQHVAVVVVRVDDVQVPFAACDLANQTEPLLIVGGNHGCVDQDVAVPGLDQAHVAAFEVVVNVNAWCDLLHSWNSVVILEAWIVARE